MNNRCYCNSLWIMACPMRKQYHYMLFSNSKSCCNYFSNHCLFLSSSADAPPVDDAAATAAALLVAKQRPLMATISPPRPIFPWRHEPHTNLLPRLTEGTPEYETDLQLPHRLQSFVANYYLQIPMWKAYLGIGWRRDLADSCTFAFIQGVAGILSNMYHIPVSQLIQEKTGPTIDSQNPDNNNPDDCDIQISFNNLAPPSNQPTANEDLNQSNVNPNEPPKTDSASSTSDTIPVDSTIVIKPPNVDSMFHRSLRDLYQSAHRSGAEQLSIRLETRPLEESALLYSVFAMPFVSRKAAASNPALIQRIYQAFGNLRTDPYAVYRVVTANVDQQFQRQGYLETTVELQVYLECEEIFQVRDNATGQVVQGRVDGLKQRVGHVIRLESTVTTTLADTFPYNATSTIDNWQITDIDDLLGPTTWYHPQSAGKDPTKLK